MSLLQKLFLIFIPLDLTCPLNCILMVWICQVSPVTSIPSQVTDCTMCTLIHVFADRQYKNDLQRLSKINGILIRAVFSDNEIWAVSLKFEK